MPDAEANIKVIRPGQLIDGLGNLPQKNMAVALRQSKILWVGPSTEVRDAVGLGSESEYETLSFPQATLLLGLIDCHTHTNMPGDGRTGEDINLESDDYRLTLSTRNVKRAQETGVTTLCDCGSWKHSGLSLREGLRQGLLKGSRTLVSGRPITATNGHLWFMGGETDGVEAARRLTRQLIEEGVDFIKVAASGGSTLTSNPNLPSLTVPELRTVVEEAHHEGKKVFAHCRCTVAINNVLDAGVDGILHGTFYDPDGTYRFDEATAERLANSSVWVNPTFHIGRTRIQWLRRKKEQEGLIPAEKTLLELAENADGNRIQQFQRLAKMGVPLIGGSDCGWANYPFGDYQGELVALVEAGYTPGKQFRQPRNKRRGQSVSMTLLA